jgi:hypothetical protein
MMNSLKMQLALSYPYSGKRRKTKRLLRDSDCTSQIDTKVIIYLQPRAMSHHLRTHFTGTILSSDAGVCLDLVVFIVRYTTTLIYMAFQSFVWSFQISLVCLNVDTFFQQSLAGLIDIRGWFKRKLLTFRENGQFLKCGVER